MLDEHQHVHTPRQHRVHVQEVRSDHRPGLCRQELPPGRPVHSGAGISAHPDGAWSTQRARELAMAREERLEAMRFLIRDRGGQFTQAFAAVFESCGVRVSGLRRRANALLTAR